jgi:hypothetical protein
MVARGKLFTMRWSEEEAAQAEAVAQHYGVPVASLFRMFIAREAKAIGKAVDIKSDPLATKDPARREEFRHVLIAIGNVVAWRDRGARTEDLLAELSTMGFNWAGWKRFPAMLNQLRRAGYTVRNAGRYSLTPKGQAAIARP